MSTVTPIKAPPAEKTHGEVLQSIFDELSGVRDAVATAIGAISHLNVDNDIEISGTLRRYAECPLNELLSSLMGMVSAEQGKPDAQASENPAVSTERQLSIDAADTLADIENVLQVCVGSLRDPDLGLDPFWWTDQILKERNESCPRKRIDMRRSFGARWWN